MKPLRIDHVTVVTPDATAASATFARLFGLASAPSAVAGTALAIGDARIEFVTPAPETPLGDALRAGGEGMAALTLTVADLGDTQRALAAGGVPFEVVTVDGRQTIAVDPRAAHGVRLTLRPRN